MEIFISEVFVFETLNPSNARGRGMWSSFIKLLEAKKRNMNVKCPLFFGFSSGYRKCNIEEDQPIEFKPRRPLKFFPPNHYNKLDLGEDLLGEKPVITRNLSSKK